jgi:hypothetical protein
VEKLKVLTLKELTHFRATNFAAALKYNFLPLKKKYLFSIPHTPLAGFGYGLYSVFILTGFIIVSGGWMPSLKPFND